MFEHVPPILLRSREGVLARQALLGRVEILEHLLHLELIAAGRLQPSQIGRDVDLGLLHHLGQSGSNEAPVHEWPLSQSIQTRTVPELSKGTSATRHPQTWHSRNLGRQEKKSFLCLLLWNRETKSKVSPLPLDVIDAEVQGELGYIINPDNPKEIQNSIINILKRKAPKKFFNREFIRKSILEEYGKNRHRERVKNILNLFKIPKLAIIMSHAIQYQVPLLRKIVDSRKINLMTYFNWDFGVNKKGSIDPEFKIKVKWDIPVLEGYKYKFLKNF